MRILIAEDDFASRKVILKFLSEYGECDVTVDGMEAIDAFMMALEDGDPYDLICLDVMMPIMDGFQFMDAFRKNRTYDNIPVIIATSDEDWHAEQKCLEAGVWDFVMKPYDPVLLRFRIKNAIEKSRMIMAEMDMVTGLYTKFKFYRAVRTLLLEGTEEVFAFVRFDIDRFKMINNFYGVREGDRVLQSIASELRKASTVFNKFVYGRFENDIFAVCMPYKEENIDLLINDVCKSI